MIRQGGLVQGQGIVNPARAGMIPAIRVAAVIHVRKPRASGDDPYADHCLPLPEK